MSIESAMPSNHLILCHPILLLPSLFLSIRVYFNESVLCIRWPKYWSFSFSISPSNDIQDWFPLGLTSLISCYPRDSQESSATTILWHPPMYYSVPFHCQDFPNLEINAMIPCYWKPTVLPVEQAFAGCSHKMEEAEARNCSSRIIATFLPLAVSWQ